jgi:hypothetical protein
LLVTLFLSAASNQWSGWLFAIAAMYVVTETLTIVVALPAYFVLRHFWRVRFGECILSGMMIGLVPAAIGVFYSPSEGYSAGDSGGDTIVKGKVTRHGVIVEIRSAAFQSGMGGAIGLCFWLIGIAGSAPRRKEPASTPASQ